MAECSFWWASDGSGWCDAVSHTCECFGQQRKCTLADKPVVSALAEEKRASMAEEALRAKKRRAFREMN